MTNPWEEISLSDYENHMSLGSVMQLQALNELMKDQLSRTDVSTVMILGIAGGNGLEHVLPDRFQKVYGVDVNPSYLRSVEQRYAGLGAALECLCLDLMNPTDVGKLPRAELLIANLLVEYIGYDCFRDVVRQVRPCRISCVIQINEEDGWVSDSPYLHAFDALDAVHFQMEEDALASALGGAGYRPTARLEHSLPNGKKLVQLDFEAAC